MIDRMNTGFILLAAFAISLANEDDNPIIIEAEDYKFQEKNEIRSWVTIKSADHTDSIAENASKKTYIQCLPDTRVVHSDKLLHGENFSNNPGEIAVIYYEVKIKKPGRYYVWVRCYSTGTEDNGIHLGIDGTWPESGKRMQWCEGKGKWTWASKQRTDTNHCGEPHKIFLDIQEAGLHTIMFSMREDGFRMDQFLLTNDKFFDP